MKFESKLKLSKLEIEAIILDHLKAKDTRGLNFRSVKFQCSGGDDTCGGWNPPHLDSAEIEVEMEVE